MEGHQILAMFATVQSLAFNRFRARMPSGKFQGLVATIHGVSVSYLDKGMPAIMDVIPTSELQGLLVSQPKQAA